MFRPVLLFLVVVASLSASASTLPEDLTSSDYDASPLTRSKRTLGELGDLGSLVRILKDQIQTIIEESILHVLRTLRVCLQHLKVWFLKRIGKYRLSDIFHGVFDSVTEFIEEYNAADSTNDEEVTAKAEYVKRAYGYVDANYGWA